MTIALDNTNNYTETGANPTLSFTPTGTPRAIVVGVVSQFESGIISAMTYDGQAMAAMTGSPNSKAATESGQVEVWWIDSATLDSSAADIVITGTAKTRAINVWSLTAGGEIEIQDIDVSINSDSQADPQVTLSANGEDIWAGISFFSGSSSITGITPWSGWTDDFEYDFGVNCAGHYSHDAIVSSDITDAGWDRGTVADDAIGIAFALNEIAAVPVLSSPTGEAKSGEPTTAAGTVSTDIDSGTLYSYLSTNSSESASTIKTNGNTITVSSSGVQNIDAFGAPGSTVYQHFVHTVAGDSNVVSTASSFTLGAAYAGSATYSGSPIPATSILFVTSGTMTATDDTSTPDRLTDAAASFGATGNLIGMQAYNVTDVSFATLTASTGTTADGNLAGGSDNSWDNGDAYQILIMADTDDVIYFQNTATVSSESASFNYYIYDDSAGTYSAVASVTITASGAADGTYDVTMDTEGTPTLTLQASVSSGAGGNTGDVFYDEDEIDRKKVKDIDSQNAARARSTYYDADPGGFGDFGIDG